MADDSKPRIIIEATLDSSSAKDAINELGKVASNVSKTVDSSFSNNSPLKEIEPISIRASASISNIGKSLLSIAGPMLTIGGILGGIKKAIDLIKIDEANNQLVNSFNAAADSAGVLADNLKSALDSARGGAADLEDVLKITTIGLNELGKGAERYPELLEIARKASIQFGGDVTEIFDKLNNAIISGSTRGIRNIAVIEANEVYKEYARTLGTTADQLTEFEKRQALLNAIIEKGSKNLAGVDLNAKTLTSSLIEVKTAFEELIEAIASLINKSKISDFFKSAADQVSQFLKNLKSLAEPEHELTAIRKRISEINSELSSLSTKENLFGFLGYNAKQEREKLEQELSELNKKVLQFMKPKQAEASIEIPIKPSPSIDPEVENILIQNKERINQKLAQLEAQAEQARFEARLSQAVTNEDRYAIELERLSLDHARRLASIDAEFANLRFIDQAQRNEARLLETDRFNAEVIKLEQRYSKIPEKELKKKKKKKF